MTPLAFLLWYYLCFSRSWSVDGFVPAQSRFDHVFQPTSAQGLFKVGDKGTEKLQNSGYNNTTKATRRKWEESYDLLVEFYQEHGHADVPSHYKEDPKLGMWVENHRRRRFTMAPDKIAKLDALNFTWDGAKAKKHDENWDQMFQCLEEFKEKAGHCNVPYRYQPNQKLAFWVYTQRRFNTLGRIRPDRFHRLDSIGFVWRLKEFREVASEKLEEKWEKRFRQLVEYRKKNGDCQVPYLYAKNPPLSKWVTTQRVLHAESEIRADRKQRLDDIGFTWDFDEIWDEVWHRTYNQLIEIMKKHQKERDLNKHSGTWASPANEVEVYNWELDQRASFLRGTLNPQREALLAEIGYWDSLGPAKKRTEKTLKTQQEKM